jgi:hypothetical protein
MSPRIPSRTPIAVRLAQADRRAVARLDVHLLLDKLARLERDARLAWRREPRESAR